MLKYWNFLMKELIHILFYSLEWRNFDFLTKWCCARWLCNITPTSHEYDIHWRCVLKAVLRSKVSFLVHLLRPDCLSVFSVWESLCKNQKFEILTDSYTHSYPWFGNNAEVFEFNMSAPMPYLYRSRISYMHIHSAEVGGGVAKVK